MTKRITRILDANKISLTELIAKSNEALIELKWITTKNVIVVREEAEAANTVKPTFSFNSHIAAAQASDDGVSSKIYKKEVKAHVAETITAEFLGEFLLKMEGAIDTAIATGAECTTLGFTDVTPPSKDGVDMSDQKQYVQYRLAWEKFNNFTRIAALETYVESNRLFVNNITLKALRRLYEGILRNEVRSHKTKNPGMFIVNSIIPILLKETQVPKPFIMNIVQGMSDAGILDLRKHAYTKKDNSGGAIDWMIDVDMGDVTELTTTQMMTSKQNLTLGAVDQVTTDNHMISQRAWHYANLDKPDIAVTAYQYISDTKYSFRDGLTEDEVRYAVSTMLQSDSDRANDIPLGSTPDTHWQHLEMERYVHEWRRAIENGNVFSLRRFLDSANRIYDEAMFGFQKSSAMKELLRFAERFEYSEADWDEVKWAAVVVYEDIHADNQKKAVAYYNANHETMLFNHGDDRGYFHAINNPSERTNIILFLDATTQGTQLYGAVSCSAELLQQGGATISQGETFEKAYALLARELNWLLAIEEDFTAVKDVFNTKNVKSLHMTALYNSGKGRLLEGRGFQTNVEEWELALQDEYETSTSKLGKLEPLLMTIREAGLKTDRDVIYELFMKALRKIAQDALDTMSRVNTLVKEDTLETEVYTWTSPDGMPNQYAMVEGTEETLSWITNTGEHHSLTYHDKKLTPGYAWRGLAPRWIQSLDAYLVRYIVLQGMEVHCPFALVHDSYGVPASFVKSLRQWYRDGLCSIVDADPLLTLAEDVVGHTVSPKFSLQYDRDNEAIKRQIQASSNALMY